MSHARMRRQRRSPGTRWEVSLRILRDYRAELSAFEVTPLQGGALLYLQENPGSYIRQCAKVMGMTGPTMGQIVTRSEQKGWMRKQRAPADDRKVLLTMTRKGTDLVRKLSRLLHVARMISTRYAIERRSTAGE